MPRKPAADKDELLAHPIIIRVNGATYKRLEKLLEQSSCKSIGEVARKILTGGRINCFYRDVSLNGPMDKMGFYARGENDSSGSGGISAMAEKMGFGGVAENAKTEEINAKLAALDREINSPSVDIGGGKSAGYAQPLKQNDTGMKTDVDRLEMLMNSMKQDKGSDPEIEQMNEMLEKLLDIQNPAKAQQKLVSKIYGDAVEREFLAVPAEVADGMPGLSAPDAVLGDVASGGAVDALGGISVYGMDGIKGQVAGAGIDAAKRLFSRKVKVVRVKLKAGQKVLLRNNSRER